MHSLVQCDYFINSDLKIEMQPPKYNFIFPVNINT